LGYVGREKSAGVAVTQLYPTRAKAMQINAVMMQGLESDGRAFERKSVVQPPEALTRGERERRQQFTEKEIRMELAVLSSGLLCEPELLLKVGAQVMCVVNIKEDETDSSSKELLLCNGSQGIVIGFSEPTGYPIVRFNSGLERVMEPHLWASERIPGVGVSQIPLLLAWALTIHKSQGATLDAAEIDVGSGIFACGQTYVALSRVKSLTGLYLKSFDVEQIRIHPRVKAFYSGLNNVINLQIPNGELAAIAT
jgi:ATP-dependent DNA helicase PIF1